MSVTTDRRLLSFCLRRPSNGVCLLPGGSVGGEEVFYLAERSPWTGKLYDPREEAPHLLQEFTRLPTDDPEAYAHFASQWGLLGLVGAYPISDADSPDEELVDPEPGEWGTGVLEAVPQWTRTVLELRTIGSLHGALLAHDRAELDRLLVLRDGTLYFRDSISAEIEHLRELAGGAGIADLNEWMPHDTFAVAPFVDFGSECIDGNLVNAAWDLLVWSTNTRTEHLIGYGLRAPDPANPSELQLRLSPRGQLYAWLWLQLAEQIARRNPMQRCLRCRDWYFQNPGARRQHGRYCSPRCRVGAHRDRKSRGRTHLDPPSD